MSTSKLSFEHRAQSATHPLAKKLFYLMSEKKTNLAFSADVTSKDELLRLADQLGPEICVLKIHVDIISDFTASFIIELKKLAEKHQFLLFEDRKFADIGNTVQLQYSAGIFRISEWADIVNAHSLPGEGIIQGLKKIGLEKNRGLLLLAEMSSMGNLISEEYVSETLAMAKKHKDFVMGFIAQQRLLEDPEFIYMTPGVGLSMNSDNLGQNYLHPNTVIIENDSDIIIVGRHIYQNQEPLTAAKQFRELGWQAYLKKLGM